MILSYCCFCYDYNYDYNYNYNYNYNYIYLHKFLHMSTCIGTTERSSLALIENSRDDYQL